MKAILGRKIGMSQVFSESGEVQAVTLIVATPNVLVLRRGKNSAGEEIVQLGLPRRAAQAKVEEKLKSGELVVPKKPSQQKKMFEVRREFNLETDEGIQTVTVEQFSVGDMVEVTGVSKGKGFQGVVKRHGFKGGPASHGHRHVLRAPGSIGGRYPQHVFKGMRMAGRMGGEQVTVKNLTVVMVDNDQNLLAIKGAIPGRKNSVVEVRLVKSKE